MLNAEKQFFGFLVDRDANVPWEYNLSVRG